MLKGFGSISLLHNLLYFSIVPFIFVYISKQVNMDIDSIALINSYTGMLGSFIALIVFFLYKRNLKSQTILVPLLLSLSPLCLLVSSDNIIVNIGLFLFTFKFGVLWISLNHRSLFLTNFEKRKDDVIIITKNIGAICTIVGPMIFLGLNGNGHQYILVFVSVIQILLVLTYLWLFGKQEIKIPEQQTLRGLVEIIKSFFTSKNGILLSVSYVSYMMVSGAVYIFIPKLLDSVGNNSDASYSYFISANALGVILISFIAMKSRFLFERIKKFDWIYFIAFCLSLSEWFYSTDFFVIVSALILSLAEVTYGTRLTSLFFNGNKNTSEMVVIQRVLGTILGIEFGVTLIALSLGSFFIVGTQLLITAIAVSSVIFSALNYKDEIIK